LAQSGVSDAQALSGVSDALLSGADVDVGDVSSFTNTEDEAAAEMDAFDMDVSEGDGSTAGAGAQPRPESPLSPLAPNERAAIRALHQQLARTPSPMHVTPASPLLSDPLLQDAPPTVQQLHEDTFSECEDAWSCPRPHHAYCRECHLSVYHSEQCVHLRDYADGLDFDA
jgi:hypothetical protein